MQLISFRHETKCKLLDRFPSCDGILHARDTQETLTGSIHKALGSPLEIILNKEQN